MKGTRRSMRMQGAQRASFFPFSSASINTRMGSWQHKEASVEESCCLQNDAPYEGEFEIHNHMYCPVSEDYVSCRSGFFYNVPQF